MTSLVLALSLTSFLGFGLLILNGIRFQNISHELTELYNDSLARESFSQFNEFLNTTEATSSLSLELAENYYRLRNIISRQDLAAMMVHNYHTTFARETTLLGGGAFFEPYAFYPDIERFHYFCNKELASDGSIPPPDRVVWIGDEWEWDVDTYEEGWYLVALPKNWDRRTPRPERFYWSELYIDTSVDALMVTVSLPIYSPERYIVGVATIDVSLSTLQQIISSIQLPTPSTQIAGFSVVNNATFAITGSTSFDIVDYPAGSWLNHLSGIKPGESLIRNITLDGIEYSLTAFVHKSGIGVATLIPTAEKFAVIDALQIANYTAVAVVVLVMIAVIILVNIFISRMIIKPVRRTFHVLETFSKGDLTQIISSKGKDELARMMNILGSAQEGIRNLVINIKKEASALSDIGSSLASNMNQTAVAVNEISSNTQNMKSRILAQSATVSETHSTMEQIVSNLNKLNGHVESQSSNVSQASSAIEQMVANITSVTRTLINNADNVKVLKDASEVGRTGLQDVAADIQEIARESEGLMEINSVMENIASQTNLLSMNAAIEAAHAGEAGKGFAVVADEIRKLAENSSEQSKTIGTVLKKIKTSIEKITSSTENVLTKFEAIDSSVSVVAEQEYNIRSAMEEQGAGSKQILEGIGGVNEITRQVKNDSAEMLEGTREVIKESEELEKVTQDITTDINEMATSTEHINLAVNHVKEISGKNREAIDVLMKEVARFNVEKK